MVDGYLPDKAHPEARNCEGQRVCCGWRHVCHVNCNLSIASERAKFGQAGLRVGSFDPGFGTGDLWRNVGLKKAKEMWYLCRFYTAEEDGNG